MWAQSPAELGKIVAAARRHKQLTQAQVAAALGVTQAWISQIEKGKDNAQLGKVLRLLSHLGVRLRVGEAPWLASNEHSPSVAKVSLSSIIDAHSDETQVRRRR
jgi:HTH-type transcriptional regulator/antitoxin HipB